MASLAEPSTVAAPAPGRLGRRNLRWTVGACAAAGLVSLPLLAVVWIALFPTENIWPHLLSTVLPRYLKNTLILLGGVGTLAVIIGVGTAWLVTMCKFPARRVFEWLMILPFAAPAYVVAYVYTDLLEYAGPVQGWLRDLFGWGSPRDYWFPEIRSHGGAIFVLAFVLYPYVYMMARAAMLAQSVCLLEASRVLGQGPWTGFFRTALPLARPAIAVGLALVSMETLADFGTVDYFGIHTLTAGIFEVWFGMGNAGGAAQIALVMLGFVLVLVGMERVSRRGQRYHHTTTRVRPLPRYRLTGWRAAAAVAACALPVLLGFVVPAGVLVRMAVVHFAESATPQFFVFAGNSLALSGIAAFCALVVGVFLAYAQRLHGTPLLRSATRIAAIGYAVPGAVLAVGVIIPFAAFDNAVDAAMRNLFGLSTGLILSGTVVAILFAYVVRFLAVGLGAVEAALTKVTPSMDDASRTLGHGPLQTLRQVHLPLVRSGVIAGALLVFVDCMKELPATLILRPFNFDTLATHVYQYASDELLEQSALGALTIVAAGIVPVIMLASAIRRSRPGTVRR